MALYLLHFHKPFKHAKHYLGFVASPDQLERRIEQHRKGNGSRLYRVIKEAGIGFEVAWTRDVGDRTEERRLKKLGGASRICPICKAKAKAASS